MGVCAKDQFIDPVHGEPGHVVVLTKPLGTQIAVNLNEWLQDEANGLWDTAKCLFFCVVLICSCYYC